MKRPSSPNYIPGTVPTADNWPANLRMPPRRQQPAKKKLEKANHEGPPSESGKPPLWDFSDLPK